MIKLLGSLLLDIIQFADRIGEYIDEFDFENLVIDNKTQDAVLKNIKNIGIAAKRIREQYPEVLDIFPELPLAEAYEMRWVIAHDYDIVNQEIIWRTVTEDIPMFRDQVAESLEKVKTLRIEGNMYPASDAIMSAAQSKELSE